MKTDFKTKAKDITESDGVHPTVNCWNMSKTIKKEGGLNESQKQHCCRLCKQLEW